MTQKHPYPLIVGRAALLVIDIQKGCFMPRPPSFSHKLMPDFQERLRRTRLAVDAARQNDVPIIFFQEAHRDTLVDLGRELDGGEGVHCLESATGTDLAWEEMDIRSDDLIIRKRRYSCFFGTELEILLRGLKVQTLIMAGGFTDVCVHYTFVDGHQGDYHCRVIEDCVAGSSTRAHDAALEAMEYLQTGARRHVDEVIDAFSSLKI